MEQTRILEQAIEEFIAANPKRTVFIILNRYFLSKASTLNINSICLHLKGKYNCLQWPKLCVDNEKEEALLFIGVME